MEYTKQPITLAEQINILKQRGLTFEDENAALRILSQISYFRLASYWRVMGFYEAPPRLLVATGGGEFFFQTGNETLKQKKRHYDPPTEQAI